MVVSNSFLFSPLFGEDEPILTSIFFRWVGKNHQLASYVGIMVNHHKDPNFSKAGFFHGKYPAVFFFVAHLGFVGGRNLGAALRSSPACKYHKLPELGSRREGVTGNSQGLLGNPTKSLKNHTLGIQSPCQMMIGVYNHLLSKVFRFHYHSQKVIGSLGIEKP